MATEPPSHPQIDWFEEAYATSPLPVLIVDSVETVLYCNQPTHALLGIDEIATLDDLAGSECATGNERLSDVIRRTLDRNQHLTSWQGQVNLGESKPLVVEFVALPGPSPLLLCRIHSYRHISTEARARLISDLGALHRRETSLKEAGRAVVESINDHLETAAVIIWYRDGTETDRWMAGDEQICHQLATVDLNRVAPQSNPILSFYTDDDQEALKLSLVTGKNSSADLMLATGCGALQSRANRLFWNCLASTAGTTLHGAHLLELNRQERLRLRAVIEDMPIAVLIFDLQGTILDLNLRARAMVGRRSWKQLQPQQQPFEIYDKKGQKLAHDEWPFMRAIAGGRLCEEEEFVLDFGDRRRTISITIRPITNEQGAVDSFVATGRDVTQRSQQEQRKDDFLSVASHELRSPLTPLAGLLQLSRKQAESSRSVDPQLLRRAESHIERLERLIDNLLDMSRIESGTLPIHRQPVDMVALIESILAPWFEGPTKERIQTDLPDHRVKAHVDPDRIDQVLTNVVDNAAKHGRPNGTIEVRLDYDDQQLQLIVCDEGDGMPQEVIDRVFDRYFFVPGTSASTGLGLYISRQIVNDHGGSISIDSDIGEPTTVTIALPRAPA